MTTTRLDRPDNMPGWRKLVALVRHEWPALAAVLGHARVIRFDASVVEIAFDPGSFYLDFANERDNRTCLGYLLAAHFGAPVALRITANPEPEPVWTDAAKHLRTWAGKPCLKQGEWPLLRRAMLNLAEKLAPWSASDDPASGRGDQP